jgi:hypothetical protein
LIGRLITADTIRKDLDKLATFRVQKIKELFS